MLIVGKKVLVNEEETRITRLEVLSPELCRKAEPGQFVMVMTCPEGERIPLTLVDRDEAKGTVSLIVQEVGHTSRLLGRMEPGDSLHALVGPLGHPTPIKNYGTVLLVGGGVGIAEIYPVARGLKAAGNKVICIIGARTKGLLILEEELKPVSDELLIATDDGSYGQKAFTTDILKQKLQEEGNIKLVYSVGPIPMMSRVAQVTRKFKVKSIVCLNALMVDGTGMCGCCRVTIGNKTKFTCVDGPEFDAHEVDWQELTQRNRVYEEQENHICKLFEKQANGEK